MRAEAMSQHIYQDGVEAVSVESIAQLQPGDIIRHVNGADGYIVTGNAGDHVIAVRVMHVTNPRDWLLISRADHKL
jgi:hypothetical protein